jgi:hypothetical protein
LPGLVVLVLPPPAVHCLWKQNGNNETESSWRTLRRPIAGGCNPSGGHWNSIFDGRHLYDDQRLPAGRLGLIHKHKAGQRGIGLIQ